MKIFILPVNQKLQPHSQPFRYPGHNDDYGVEQDFYLYLSNHPELLTQDPKKADFHYLPVFWTRWHLNHDFGQTKRDELQRLVNRSILDDVKTVIICQYADGPLINVGKSIVFLSSRKGKSGIDIPLLCSPHKLPSKKPPKKYLASFVGSLKKHPIRAEMADYFKNAENIFIYGGNKGRDFFVQKMLQSFIALCPRGYGGSSFRFYEAMQMGVVPLLISADDVRPFKRFIQWKRYSLYAKNMKEAEEMMNRYSKEELASIGAKSASLWKKKLTYGKWCKYVLKELKHLSR